MTAGVNLQELGNGDVGINRGRIEFLVAEELLDEPDVGPGMPITEVIPEASNENEKETGELNWRATENST